MPRKTKQNEYTVYKHENLINGKVYIGITSTNIYKRAGLNGANYKKNTLFYRAIEKYGWNNFSHEVIMNELSFEDASKTEVMLIAEYNSTDPHCGYNISSGGESGHSGCNMSSNEREIRSSAMKGVQNPCFGKYGKEHPSYGYKHSNESKKAVSAALTNRTYSNETIEKMSIARKRIGAWRGERNPMSGKTYGTAPHSRKVRCVETGEVFDSVKRAAEYIGTFSTSITAACSGRQQTCKGLHWKYANVLEECCHAS